MFRVTDGLRMTMHHMLFIPFGEPTRKPDTPMTAPEVHAYAERAFSLHSEHGVCAGPKVMIDEFLSVIIDGRTPRDGLPAVLDAELQATLADIEPALDYALLGLQAYAAVFSLWPMTMRCYEQLHAVVQAWVRDEPTAPVLARADDVYTNHIHADDLARACWLALWRGRSQRVYNVNDDSQLLMGDYYDLAADLYGLPRARRISRAQAEGELSALTLSFMQDSRRMDNRRMKRELRLRLRYPEVQQGLLAGWVGKGDAKVAP